MVFQALSANVSCLSGRVGSREWPREAVRHPASWPGRTGTTRRPGPAAAGHRRRHGLSGGRWRAWHLQHARLWPGAVLGAKLALVLQLAILPVLVARVGRAGRRGRPATGPASRRRPGLARSRERAAAGTAAGRLAGRRPGAHPGSGRAGRRAGGLAGAAGLRRRIPGRGRPGGADPDLPRRVPGPGILVTRLRRCAPAGRHAVLRAGRPGLARPGRGSAGHRCRWLPRSARGGRPGPRRAGRGGGAMGGRLLGSGPGHRAVRGHLGRRDVGAGAGRRRPGRRPRGCGAAPGGGRWPAGCCCGWPPC